MRNSRSKFTNYNRKPNWDPIAVFRCVRAGGAMQEIVRETVSSAHLSWFLGCAKKYAEVFT